MGVIDTMRKGLAQEIPSPPACQAAIPAVQPGGVVEGCLRPERERTAPSALRSRCTRGNELGGRGEDLEEWAHPDHRNVAAHPQLRCETCDRRPTFRAVVSSRLQSFGSSWSRCPRPTRCCMQSVGSTRNR